MNEEPVEQGIERQFSNDVIKLMSVFFMSIMPVFILCAMILQKQDYRIPNT